MQKIIDAAIEYIRRLFAENADGHGLEHALRVYRTALHLAKSAPAADPLVVALGALLHDADDHKLFHTEHNANARRFLTEQGVDAETADRLDAIGAVGIARTFAYGGKHGRTPEDSIAHFHEKLLLLKDLMNTEQAKALAEERHAFMEAFLRQWDRETDISID